MADLLLGVDLGTATVKVVLVSRGDHQVLEERSQVTRAAVPSCVADGDEQCVVSILAALENAMSSFPVDKLKRVRSVGVSGQMHGCVLWRRGSRFFDAGKLTCEESSCSPLVTWQDGRCGEELLSSLPVSSQAAPVKSGYGCATLSWYQHNRPHLLEVFDTAGTVMDLVVCALCGRGQVLMSDQIAFSWGCFCYHSGQWEHDLLKSCGFPVYLLPRTVPAPCFAGKLAKEWHHVPAGIPVGVAMGDLQCSVCAAMPEPGDAVVNIGSGAQLSIVRPPSLSMDILSVPSLLEVPYFGQQTLVVAAALTGGNVIVKFVEFLREALTSMGVSNQQVTDSLLYSVILSSAQEKIDSTLQINPVLLGERHCPAVRATVCNLSPDNLTLGDVGSALMRGMAENLCSMMPTEVLAAGKVNRLLASGSTLHRNQVLKEHFERVFNMSVELRSGADAPFGAAVAAEELLS